MAQWRNGVMQGIEGVDGTDGNQPRGTRIISNIISENGHYSKQASPYFQASYSNATPMQAAK